jgi:hypothetical protein
MVMSPPKGCVRHITTRAAGSPGYFLASHIEQDEARNQRG